MVSYMLAFVNPRVHNGPLLNLNENYQTISNQACYQTWARRYLEEAELVRGLVGADDEGLDIPDVDVAAGDGKR